MLKRISVGIFVVVLGAVFVRAQQPPLTITAARTNANDGRQMYSNYCASCHGTNGRGRGPMAARLRTAPTDLTLLSRNNGGAYPALQVKAMLQCTSPIHGAKQMPAWGSALAEVDRRVSTDLQNLRIRNLVEYVHTLQAN